MTKYQIKKIDIKWILTTMSSIFAIIGAIVGIFTFFFFPQEATTGLGFGARLLAWLIFIILYTIIMVVGILVIVLLYNYFSPKTGSITFFVESQEE